MSVLSSGDALRPLDPVQLASGDVAPAVLTWALKALSAGDIAGALAWLNEETLHTIHEAARATPARVDWLFITADLLMRLDQFESAVRCLESLVEIHPCAVGYHRLSQALKTVGRLKDSTDWAHRAVDLEPDRADYQAQWGQGLFDLGDLHAGLALTQKACALCPDDPSFVSQRLGMEHYLEDRGRDSFQADYQCLGRLVARGHVPQKLHVNTPDPDRRLRIGILCPFFRRNSIAYAFEPLLDGADLQQWELVGYSLSPVGREDEVTARMARKFDRFQRVVGMATDDLVTLILRDRIDILIEIAGYVGGHRMDVMACKPAPVQVDLGAVDTTGLPQIDYRLTDPWLDPWELSHPYTETSVYLPHGCQCYRPWDQSPAVTSPPMLSRGHVTFGAFHDHRKISDVTLGLWAQVLRALPDAKLVIKCRDFFDGAVQQRMQTRCEAAGCDIDRVTWRGWTPPGDHLHLLSQIDLMLDTAPHTGSIMTLEALWMGVPTVSLTGAHYMSRMGHSILSRVGLEPFVAHSSQEYVDKAVSFARQPQALAQIRSGLRPAMLRSPLCHAKQYAEEIAWALRHIWYRWCRGQGVRVDIPEPPGLFREGRYAALARDDV